jgi:hypothetical protein
MSTLKITMLFLGMSVTSFAQIFNGFDTIQQSNGDKVYVMSAKTRADAIHKTFKMLDDNEYDTTKSSIVRNSDVVIFMNWVDQFNTKKVYILITSKLVGGDYRVSVIYQDNKYTEYFAVDDNMLRYVPE